MSFILVGTIPAVWFNGRDGSVVGRAHRTRAGDHSASPARPSPGISLHASQHLVTVTASALFLLHGCFHFVLYSPCNTTNKIWQPELVVVVWLASSPFSQCFFSLYTLIKTRSWLRCLVDMTSCKGRGAMATSEVPIRRQPIVTHPCTSWRLGTKGLVHRCTIRGREKKKDLVWPWEQPGPARTIKCCENRHFRVARFIKRLRFRSTIMECQNSPDLHRLTAWALACSCVPTSRNTCIRVLLNHMVEHTML